MDELIRKSDAIEAVSEPYNEKFWDYVNQPISDVVNILKSIPAVEPWDLYDCDEWCRDCKEYDAENHRCPRWNRVIRRTVEENQPKQGEWIDMGDFEQCSVCKGTHLKEFQSYYGKVTWVKTPYCPNCGAKMKGIDDETD